MPKISVLVPVCNVERYLEQCMESLIRQTFGDMEIICVDDGSTDGSGTILDRYAAMDPRIQVIHKANTGYGNSMNVALNRAQGAYIAILESDDFAEPDMLQTLYEAAAAQDADVVKGTFYNYQDGQDTVSSRLDHFPKNTLMNIHACPTLFNLADTIWSCLYRTSFLRKHNICFHETPGASYQDISFALQVWMHAQSVYLIENAVIHYRRDNPLSSMNNPTKVFCVFDEYSWAEKRFQDSLAEDALLYHYFEAAKYQDYLNHYYRVGIQYQYALLCRLEAELQKDRESGRMLKEAFEASVWEMLTRVSHDRNLFFQDTARKTEDARLRQCKFQNETVYMTAFFESLKAYPQVVIYGAGKVGRLLAEAIERRGGRVDGFAVSDMSAQQSVCMGIPVREVEAYLEQKIHCAIVIAVAERSQYEIYGKLRSCGFSNVFRVDAAAAAGFAKENAE